MAGFIGFGLHVWLMLPYTDVKALLVDLVNQTPFLCRYGEQPGREFKCNAKNQRYQQCMALTILLQEFSFLITPSFVSL